MPRKRRRRKNKQHDPYAKPTNVVNIKTASGTKKYGPAYTKQEKFDPLDNGTWQTGTGYTGTWSRCDKRHWKTPVELSEGIVINCSAWYDRPHTIAWSYPKVGLYFDNAWLGDAGFVSKGWHGPMLAHRSELAIVGWPDYDIPGKFRKTVEALEYALNKAGDGEEVEIGCLGGHGRTGTALASMLVLLGYEPDEAMNWVWTNYCSRAIETPDQERWVEQVYRYFNGHEPNGQLLLPTNSAVYEPTEGSLYEKPLYASQADELAAINAWLEKHDSKPGRLVEIENTELYEDGKGGVWWYNEEQKKWINLTEEENEDVVNQLVSQQLTKQTDDGFLDELARDYQMKAHADANHVNNWCMTCDRHADFCYCVYGIWD